MLTTRRIEEVTEGEEDEQANLDSARAMASITADVIDNIEDDIPDTDWPSPYGGGNLSVWSYKELENWYFKLLKSKEQWN